MTVLPDLVASLLRAMVRLNGQSLVVRVGECPYVVTPAGNVLLDSRRVPKAGVENLLDALLWPEARAALSASGAIEFDLPPRPDMAEETFTITVTGRDGADVRIEREPAGATGSARAAAAAPRFPPLVLMIEDSLDQLDLYELALKGRYQFLGASDGAAGVALAVERQPDAVLIDIGMPHVDGWEVCQRLKGEPRTARIPILFLTADRRAEVEAKARQCGAEGVLHKPCPMDRLRDRLGEVMSRSAM